MPDTPLLSPDEYQQIVAHTADTAPAGLSPAQYQARLDHALDAATAAKTAKTIGGFVANAASSGKRFVANTAEGLFGAGRLISRDATALMQPTEANIRTALDDPAQQGLVQAIRHPLDTAQRVGGYVADRYGSLDKAANTAYADPFGMVADASTVASVGGGALTKAGAVAKLPTLARAGEVVSALDPLAAGANLVRKIPAGDLGNAAASRVAESALKVKDALRDANPGVDIPLEAARSGAVVSRGGLRTANRRLDALDARVQAAVDASPATIDPWAASQEARDLLAERTRLQRAAPRDPAVMQQTIRDFLGNGQPMPAREAQDTKSLFGHKLTNRFGEDVIPAEAETQQALRAGTRREIEQQVPGVVEPNRQLTIGIPVRDAVQDAVNRTQRWDLAQAVKLGGGSALGGLVGFGAGHPELGAAGGAALMRLLDNPAVKSRLASGLYRAGQGAPAVGGGIEAIMPLAIRAALLDQMGGGDITPDTPPRR